MNDQQMLEILYPEPRPLTDRDRASMRSELFTTTPADSLRPLSDQDRPAGTAPDAVNGLGPTTRTDDDRRPDDDGVRRWLTVAAAAVLIAGIAGIWAAGTRSGGDTPAPAQQPATTSSPSPEGSAAPGAPTHAVPIGQRSAEPTAFPVLDDLPAGLSATTHVERMGDGWTSPRTETLIGRHIDGVLTDAVQLAVWPAPLDISLMQGRTPTEAVVFEQPASVYDYSSSGSSPLFLVTWGTGPFFVASGGAPLSLLDQLDPGAIEATVLSADEPPQLSIAALPGDFDVIVEPQRITGDATLFATLSIGADNYDISVHTSDRVLGMASSGRPLRSIEVNGQPGWTYLSTTPTHDITWQVNESTYAYLKVNDGSTAEEALALANRITFVDFDTWTARYSAEIADVPATSEASDETTVSQPTTPVTAQGLDPDAALSADDWLTVPADATDLEWQYAVEGDSGYASADTRSDQIVYGTTTDPELLIIHIHNPPLDPGIDSGVWAVYPLRDGWIETRQLGDTEITVQGADTVAPAIVDMLVVTPEQELTTGPLGIRDRATPVATVLRNGQEWTVLVERSGRFEMTYVEIRAPGNREPDVRMMAGPEPIPPGDELTVDYQPSHFAEGLSPGEVLAIGRAPSDVSSVNVELSDGTVVNAATYPAAPDHSGRYWIAVTSLAGDSHDISVANVTAAGLEGR